MEIGIERIALVFSVIVSIAVLLNWAYETMEQKRLDKKFGIPPTKYREFEVK